MKLQDNHHLDYDINYVNFRYMFLQDMILGYVNFMLMKSIFTFILVLFILFGNAVSHRNQF